MRSFHSRSCLAPGRLAAALTLAVVSLFSGGAQAAGPVPEGHPYPVFGGKPLAVERTSAKVVGMYVPMWEPVALVDALQGESVTHVLYAFLRLCGPGQLPADAARCQGKQAFELTTGAAETTFDAAFQRLKQRAPHVKVIASVGGWGGSDPFFLMNGDAANRAAFAGSAARFLREHPAFDGIDIDWEHPGNNGAANGVQLGSDADGQRYADLLVDLRAALTTLSAETGRPYLVSMAVNTTSPIINRIDFKRAEPALDLVFMMTYDFYGAWSDGIGNHTTLFSSAPEADDSLARSVRNLMQAGMPAAKLVAGVGLYGRGFSGVTQARTGAAKAGGFPGVEGALPYRQIASRYLGPQGHGLRGWQARFDATTQAWNLVQPTQHLFIGYDDPRAVIAKGRYALKNGLAGVFGWELSQDNGDILNAMNFGVGNLLQQP
ncbi:glycoside hydrolase family 18 protein [Roseateles koreensis]|uniref:chitinase n=1 Tax=Roseateles koreensis TaxID=2987526 RepID=A0ABT5KQ82_9BURK|nr:glycoside hydrolase family 18 protein [Roseateles koreensis]MDC8785011.1 glycoside hydrolase family 18 protein [Roseateles koreensis]